MRTISEITEKPHEVLEVAGFNGTGTNSSIQDSKGWWHSIAANEEYCKTSETDWIRPGMKLTRWGEDFSTRGIAVEDTVIFYLTPEEDDIRSEKYRKAYEEEEEQKWQEEKEAYFAEVAQLPEVFQERFRRFASFNPNFDKSLGRYELFCSKEALKIVDALKTAEAIREWWNEDDLYKLVPSLDQGHSGNTMGMSARFAIALIEGFLDKEHGALVGLTGCKEYGCH